MEGIMTSVKFSKLFTVLTAVALMLTLLTTAIYATDADVTTAATGTTVADTTVADTTVADTTAASTTAASTTAPTTTAGDSTENAGPNWDLIITLSVLGVAIVALLVVYFAVPRFRAWTNKKCREIKSELKNVTWSPWRDVKRNTVLVIIIVAAAAAAIGLLDFVFAKSISALAGLF